MVCTVSDMFMQMRRALREAGVSSYQLEARELLASAMGCKTDELTAKMRMFISGETAQRALSHLGRRLAGEPCAYIIGEWDFYSMTFRIPRGVLIPRPDTETLVDRALSFKLCGGERPRILDLCCGSGCIGAAIAENMPDARVVLMDISPTALAAARENLARHGLSGQASVVPGDATEGWKRVYGKFDLIVSNPPYIPSDDCDTLDNSVRLYEPRMALDGGRDGLDFYRLIAEKWLCGLNPGGRIAVEVGIGEADAVRDIFKAAKLKRISVTEDLASVPRVVSASV